MRARFERIRVENIVIRGAESAAPMGVDSRTRPAEAAERRIEAVSQDCVAGGRTSIFVKEKLGDGRECMARPRKTEERGVVGRRRRERLLVRARDSLREAATMLGAKEIGSKHADARSEDWTEKGIESDRHLVR